MSPSKDDGEDASGAGGRRSRHAIVNGPLQPTLFRVAWPIAAGTWLAECQNFISMIWIGQLIGSTGLATLAVMVPVLLLLSYVNGTIHIGVQVLAARSTGRQDGEAIPIIVNGAYLGIAWAMLVTVVGVWQLGPITDALAGDLRIGGGLRDYLLVWLLFYVVPMLTGVALFAVTATGWTRFGLIQTTVSIVLMLALMPVFVSVLDLGLAGVALSDGCSDLLLLALSAAALYRFRSDLGLGPWRREAMRLDFGLWRRIIGVSVTYQLARGVDNIAQVVLVRVIMESGDLAVAGYGITMLVIIMAAATISSLGVAAGIMVGQNVGAGKPERARECLRIALMWIAGLGVAFIVLASFAEPVFRIFTTDAAVIAQAAAALAALKWAVPAVMLGSALLRCYTAVSSNKLGNTIAMLGAGATILIALAWPGPPLERVAAAFIGGQYFRLLVLGLLYRRSFSSLLQA